MHIEFVSNFITLSLVVQQYLMRLLNNFYGKKEKEKEMFEILDKIHKSLGHGGRDRMLNEIQKHYK